MSSKYLAFIRHGDYHQIKDAPSAYQPFGLTETGFDQADEGAEILQSLMDKHGFTVDPVIHSSSLLRSWQTAETYRQNLDGIKRITTFDALAERGVGAVANLDIQTIEKILEDDPRYEVPPKNWKSNSYYRLPFIGAESLMEAGQRVAKHVRETVKNMAAPEGKKVLKLCVGHGAAIRHAAYHLGVLKFEEIAKLSMYHATPVIFEVTKDDKWKHVAGKWKVRTPKEGFTD